MTRTAETWINYAEALAFVGNSLLAPMNQTGTVGLEPAFWANFPTFDDVHVAAALKACEEFADAAQQYAEGGEDPVTRVSVEYTALFIGPPRPLAAPWETMYRPGAEDATVGFGQATFEMRRLLREAGLEVSNENNQYADHIGIELLYASVLCERLARMAGGDDVASEAPEGDSAVPLDELSAQELEEKLKGFIAEHPLEWIDRLQAKVANAGERGYIAALLELAHALLASI